MPNLRMQNPRWRPSRLVSTTPTRRAKSTTSIWWIPTWHLENFSPSDNHQTWALSSLSSLGYDAPTNLSTVGHMTVIDLEQNTEHQGIQMRQELPENNTFEGRNNLPRQRTGRRSVRRYDQLEARIHR